MKTYFEILEDSTTLNLPSQISQEPPKTKVLYDHFENNTRHQTIAPYASTEPFRIQKTPALSYLSFPFVLDTFQNLSISAIENSHSVLVSAHTSCGKTAIAEYAIAQSIKNNQRTIYTSPIKALSNQKFRELQEKFQDVGLMTGDVTLNPESSCLVMTTEILRNMLYKGSEIIREVNWIIFDEIHYMRDKSRGVVWEEAIILLPPHIKMIFLSATIPNAKEFAEWVSHIKKKVIHVVYTEKRVIPLIHQFYSHQPNRKNTNFELFEIYENQRFHSESFLCSQKEPIEKKNTGRAIQSLIEEINVPAVVFSFSRKDCESLATKIKKDFLSTEEKDLVKTIFSNAIDSLREEDRKIPIIENMLPILLKGIGIHHSGLLPIIKEIVEILFQESLIKILFATETFSIGLNMPAKTVIFSSLKKFDGQEKRTINSHEYIQMSGRAGRRGLDKFGTCISLVTEKIEIKNAKNMFLNTTDKLKSAFRLTYNMLLNLMRTEEYDTEYILRKSFYHYQAYKNYVREAEEVWNENKEKGRKALTKDFSPLLRPGARPEEVFRFLRAYEELLDKRACALLSHFLPLIEKGRLIDILIKNSGLPLVIRNCVIKKISRDTVTVSLLKNNRIETKDFLLTQIFNVYKIRVKPVLKVFHKNFSPEHFEDKEIKEHEKKFENFFSQKLDFNLKSLFYNFCVFCKNEFNFCCCKEIRNKIDNNSDNDNDSDNDCDNNSDNNSDTNDTNSSNTNDNTNDTKISNTKTISNTNDTNDTNSSNTNSSKTNISNTKTISNTNDTNNNTNISSKTNTNDTNNNTKISNTNSSNTNISVNLLLFFNSNLYKNLLILHHSFNKNLILNKKLKNLQKLREIYHLTESKKMVNLLQALGFVDGHNVLIKGKMASEISSGDELLLTEMIFSTEFSKLPILDMISLLSVSICEENKGQVIISEENKKLIEIMKNSIAKITSKMNECGIEITEEEYLGRFSFELMDVVKMWISGYTFVEVCNTTTVYEGSIIRTFKRLEELLRQLSNAAYVIGNTELVNLFGQGIYLIKRDIVFANSLYL